MTKSELQQLAQASVDAANAIKLAVDALDDSSVADLQKKIEDLNAALQSSADQIVLLQGKIDEQAKLLKEVDAKAKEIDASIPD